MRRALGHISVLTFAAALWLLPARALGAERFGVVAGGSVTFEEPTNDVRVVMRAMRLNRAQNVWNFDVTITNASQSSLTAPLALFVESWSNTTGPLQVDGNDAGDGKPFYVFPVVNEIFAPSNSVTRTLTLGVSGTRAPTVTIKAYSAVPGVTLALARTLDAAGQPLGGARIDEVGPVDGRVYTTDAEAGVATVGQGAGLHRWKFSAEGYSPVWRSEALSNGRVRMVVSPRLVKRSTNELALAAGVENTIAVGEGVALRFAASAFSAGTTARVTVVDGQTLPGLLPRGWTPVSSFSLELSSAPSSQGVLTMAAPAGGGAVALAKFDEAQVGWVLSGFAIVNGATMSVEVPGAGSYAVVVRDVEAGSADLKVDELLPGASAPVSVDLVASGSVTPNKTRASVIADLVTAQARVVVTNRGGTMPSGLVLVGDIAERYELRDGSRRFPPLYDEFLTAYRTPGGNPAVAEAKFPLRPLLLFGADELVEATVRVDISAPTNFTGGVIGTNGGLIVNGGVKARGGLGDVASAQAVLLRELNPASFADLGKNGAVAVGAAELTFGGVANGRRLKLEFPAQDPNATYVLGKVIWRGGVYGVEPRERFSSDATGALQSTEPASGARLRGVNGSGQYVLLKVPAQVAVVGGTAMENGAAAESAIATVEGDAWLSAADASGRYTLVAPVGGRTVRVRNLESGKEADATVTVTADLAAVNADVTLGTPNLRVVAVSPAPGSTNVSRIAPVVVTFSEAINPATFQGALRVLGTNGTPVIGAATLNVRNTSATFLAQTQLAASAEHTIDLAGTIATADGRMLMGARSFTFKTETDQLNRPPPQLISYEPVNGFAGLFGTPGTADSESPVILVNETTGQTATILSKVDGSFTNSIEASVDDILTAVLVNKNGSRTTLAVSKQMFRDGSVGLFNGGGILEAESDGGPLQVIVEPGAIENKTKFRVTPIPLGQLMSLLETPPKDGVKVMGGVVMSQEGDDMKVGADLSFPVDAASLGLTNAPEKCSWALATPREVDGVVLYEIIDRMQYEDGKLVTHSPPFAGALLQELQRRFRAARRFDSMNRRISAALGLPDLRATFYHVALLPLLMSQGHELIVQGRVVSVPGPDDGPFSSLARFLPGATITFAQDEFPDRPGRLQPGSTFTTAGSDGMYAILFPINRLQENGFAVRATHPAFPNQRASSPFTVASLAQQFNEITGRVTGPSPGLLDAFSAIGSAASVITPKANAHLIFHRYDATQAVTSQEDGGPPVISMTVTPVDPGPGTNTTDGAVITIAANDDLQVGTINLSMVDQFPLNPDITTNVVDVAEVLGSLTNAGPKFTQKAYRVKSQFRANVHLLATVNDSSGNLAEAEALITFAGDRPPGPVNTNDTVRPRILTTFPRNNATGIRPGQAVALQFSEAIARTNMTNITAWLTVGGGAKFSSAELSRDGKQLTVSFAPDISGAVTLTLNSSLTDLNGNSFDQDPITQGNQTFTMQFTVVNDTQNFAGMVAGGGAAMLGSYAFLLERAGPLDGALVTYDISSNAPVKLGEVNLPGYPRDLALIPNYSFVMNEGDPVQTRNLVAVVGGRIGAENVQYLWIIDVTDPAAPVRISSAIISLAIAGITKVRWEPPLLAYLEAGADITSVSIVDLQAFLIGMSASGAVAENFPLEGRLGVDANHDGDYVDTGDTLPLPERIPTEYYGKVTSIVDPDTDRRIEDFDMEGGAGLLAIVMRKGSMLGSNGLPDSSQPAKAAYRTVISGLGSLDPTRATLEFNEGMPKRMALFHQVLLAGDTNNFRNLAVVSLAESTNSLVVIDITDPLTPTEIARIDLTSFGIPQTLTRRPDGLLAVATQENPDLYLFDPSKFLLPPVAGNPASLVGIIPGAGSGARSYVADNTGINIVNLSGRHSINHTAPDIRFLSFPSMTINPALLAGLSIEKLDDTFRKARQETVLEKTRLFVQQNPTNPPTLMPINTNALYYVRMDAIGSIGGSTGRVNMVLESLNGSGLPLPNGGGASLPVRLAPTNTLTSLDDTNYMATNALAYQRDLKAVRLSNDKGSPYYNVFLAGPFVLTDTGLSSNQVTQARGQLPRGILRAGRFLWAGLDNSTVAAPYTTNILSQAVAKRLQQGDATVVNVAHIAKPLIFIPGIAGSFLWNTNTVETYWLGYDASSIAGDLANAAAAAAGLPSPGFAGSDGRHRSLSLDPSVTAQPVAPPDIIRYVVPPTSVTSGHVPIYAGILDYLTTNLAYVEYDYKAVGNEGVWPLHRTTTNALTAQIPNNPNLYVYPYDWRKDNAVSAANLREYVRLIKLFNPEVEQVDILAHSMGGLVGRRFILDNPGVVDKFITIGTPWLGAPKAITALETGDFDDLAMNILIKKETLRDLAEYFPGVHHLMPSKGYFDLGGLPLSEGSWDLNKNGAFGETYSYDVYKNAIDSVLHPSASSPVDTNEFFHSFSSSLGSQDDWRTDSTGVNYFHIYGVQSVPDTIGQVQANLRLRPVEANFEDLGVELPVDPISTNSATISTQKYVLDRRFEYVRVAGDGTVPALSAARQFNGLDYNAPSAMLFPIISPSGNKDGESEHNGMLSNPKVLEIVRDILGGVVIPPTNTPPPSPVMYRVIVANYEKGTIEVKDAGGETDDETDVPIITQIVQDLVARIINWVVQDDANRFSAQYEIANTKPGNASHTIDFKPKKGEPYSVEVLKIPAGSITPTERFRWVNVSSNLSPAQVYIDWAQQTVTLGAGLGLGSVTPTFHLTGAAAGDNAPPTMTLTSTADNDPAGDLDGNNAINVRVSDNTTAAAQQTLYIGYDEDADGDWFNNIYYLARSSLMTAASGAGTTVANYVLPTELVQAAATAILGADAGGNLTPPKQVDGNLPNQPNPDCAPTSGGSNKLQEEKDAIVRAIQKAIDEANISEWMLDTNHLSASFPGVNYILEQGSGACFWKSANNLCDDCNEVFKAGVSDHDYEVFLPVFSNWHPTGSTNLLTAPYDRPNVEGDWYFLPPTTNTAGTHRVYRKPIGINTFTNILKPIVAGEPVRTPANYLTDTMTDAAVSHLKQAGFIAAAKNLSMFSARAEHFENGFIDLDRPLEVGADATGDVGMGRQSLMLKWVLEGEYVTGVTGLSNPPPDLDIVFTRLQNAGIPELEGYEWGVYQEFAALSSGLLVRTAKPSGSADVKVPQKDFFKKIKEKQIKSAGKAAIRASFGLMVAKAPPSSFLLSRQQYRSGNYVSFEEYIAQQASQPIMAGVFGQYAPMVMTFYKAKIADTQLMKDLLADEQENNEFLADAVSFLRYVQDETEVGYQLALANMPANSPQRVSREQNLLKVLNGFPNLNKPGLIELRTDPKLKFPVRIKHRGEQAASGVKVEMTGDMQIGPVTVDVPADGYIQVPEKDDDPPVFYVAPTSTSAGEIAYITVDGGNGMEEGNVANNWLGFYYYELDPQNPSVPGNVNAPIPQPSLPTPVVANRVDVSFK